MIVHVGKQIRISNPSDDLLAWCKKNLIVPNPEYTKKVRMNFWIGNTPKTLSMMQYDGDILVLPYGCLNRVESLTGGKDSVIYDMPTPKLIWYNAIVPLYDYQQEAVACMLQGNNGILQSAPGSGKTQMGIAMAVTLGRKTLWLTHTKDLLDQSKKRAEQYMDKSLTGTITEGKVNIGKGITFATVQTMCRLDLSQYENLWDCIIVDECHRVAGSPTSVTQFSKVLNSLAARHKYGLSATVHRPDGLIATTYSLLGEIVYKVPDEAIADKIMKVEIVPRPTSVGLAKEFLDTDGTIIYAKMINYLTEDFERNALIVGDLLQNDQHYNLILSDRLNHLKYLMEHLPKHLREQAVMIDGKMTSKVQKALREKALEDMRQGKKHYLFATYPLAKEGLDIPRLDRLYLTTPQKDYAIVTQSIGRINRSFEGKGTPIAYDYVDSRIQLLVKSYKKRCTSYRKMGCNIN